jgi:hypothetical protein
MKIKPLLILFLALVLSIVSHAQNWNDLFPAKDVNSMAATLTDFQEGMESSFKVRVNDSVYEVKPDSNQYIPEVLSNKFFDHFLGSFYYGSKTTVRLQPLFRFNIGENRLFYCAIVKTTSFELGYSESLSLSIFSVFNHETQIENLALASETELAAYHDSYISTVSGFRSKEFKEGVFTDIDSNGQYDAVVFSNFQANSRNINIFTGLSGWQNQNNINIESFGLGNIENTTEKLLPKISKLSPIQMKKVKVRKAIFKKNTIKISMELENTSSKSFEFSKSKFSNFYAYLVKPEQVKVSGIVYLFNDQSFRSVLEKNEISINPGETLKLKSAKFPVDIFFIDDSDSSKDADFLIVVNVFQEGLPNYILGFDEGANNTLFYISESVTIKSIR